MAYVMACRFAGFGSCCANAAVGIGNQFTRETAAAALRGRGAWPRRTGGVFLTPLTTLG